MSGAVLLGLLGCGRAAERRHVPAIARLPGARLTAAYDPLPERREFIARLSPGCRPFPSAEALFAARVVDAVVIASPAETHGPLAVQALGAGLPALIDQPLAVSLDEAAWIREAEQIVRLPVMVGFNRRWWEPVERVRRALAEAQLGEIAVESVLVTEVGNCRAQPVAADALRALGIHLDLLRHLLDREIATVSAHRDPPADIAARLTFHGDGIALCRAGLGDRSEEHIMVRDGSRSYEVRAGSERVRPAAGVGRRALDLGDSARRRILGGRDSLTRSYERQMGAFVDGVRSRMGASPGTTDGIAAMLAVDAVRRSLAEGGAEISVPPTPAD
jgi:predicted dehydrogenase